MSVEVRQSDRKAAVALLYLIWRAEQGNVVYGWMRDEEGKTLSGQRDKEWAVQAFAAHRHQAEEAMRERAAGECLKYRLQCDMIAVQRARDGENGDAAIACSVAAELLERAIRSIDTRGE